MSDDRLEELPRPELYRRARDAGVRGTLAMSRDELAAAVRAARAESDASSERAKRRAGVSANGARGRASKSASQNEAATGGTPAESMEAHPLTLKSAQQARLQRGHLVGNGAGERPAPSNGAGHADEPRAPKGLSRQPSTALLLATTELPAPPPAPASGHESEADPSEPPPPPARSPGRGISLAATLALLTLVLGGLAWAANDYHRLVADLQRSNAHVPAAVRASLSQARTITSRPNVVLVEGLRPGGRPTGALTLFRTDPARAVLASLSLPPSARLTVTGTVARALGRRGTAGIVEALRAAGIRVDHVALISLRHLAQMVDGLGGITITNPQQLSYRRSVLGPLQHLPAGRVAMDGDLAARFLHPRIQQTGPLASPEQREEIVLRAVTDRILRPTSPGDVEAVGEMAATTLATDLSPSQVLAFVTIRLDARRFVECTVPAGGSLTAGAGRSALAVFQGASGSTGACAARPVASIGDGVVGTLVRHVVRNLPVMLVFSLAVVGGLWAVTAVLLAAAWRPALRRMRPVRR